MEKHANSFDFILDTVSAEHDLNAYLNLLKRDGDHGAGRCAGEAVPVAAFSLIPKRRQFAGSDDRRHRRNPGDARLLRRSTALSPTSR